MRRRFRHLIVLAAMLSLVGGSWLPSDDVLADSDGICGRPLTGDGLSATLSQDKTPTGKSQHCLFCHWRHTMASASAVAFVAIAGPVEAGRIQDGRPAPEPLIADAGISAPRGPPTLV
jgi:hypothetical protein